MPKQPRKKTANEDKDEDEVKFYCNFCDAHPLGFSRPGHLTRHIQLQHREGMRWVCNRLVSVNDQAMVCGKVLATKENLKEHIAAIQ